MSERNYEWYDRMRPFCTSPACDDFCTHTFEDDWNDDDEPYDDEATPSPGAGTKGGGT